MCGNIHSAARAYILPVRTAYNRILEEATGTSRFMPVRQLFVADTPDFFGSLTLCGYMAKFILKFTQRAIFQVLSFIPGNHLEAYAQHDVPVLAFVLEERVAVSESAFLVGEPARFACKGIETFHGIYHIFRLDAVCSNILYGRGTHAARDSGHVLYTSQLPGNAPVHEFVPVHARTGYHIYILRILVVTDYAADARMKHKPFKLVYEQKIAAASQV